MKISACKQFTIGLLFRTRILKLFSCVEKNIIVKNVNNLKLILRN